MDKNIYDIDKKSESSFETCFPLIFKIDFVTHAYQYKIVPISSILHSFVYILTRYYAPMDGFIKHIFIGRFRDISSLYFSNSRISNY